MAINLKRIEKIKIKRREKNIFVVVEVFLIFIYFS